MVAQEQIFQLLFLSPKLTQNLKVLFFVFFLEGWGGGWFFSFVPQSKTDKISKFQSAIFSGGGGQNAGFQTFVPEPKLSKSKQIKFKKNSIKENLECVHFNFCRNKHKGTSRDVKQMMNKPNKFLELPPIPKQPHHLTARQPKMKYIKYSRNQVKPP